MLYIADLLCFRQMYDKYLPSKDTAFSYDRDTSKESLKSYLKRSVDPTAACDEREPRSALSTCIRQFYPTYLTYSVLVGFFRKHPQITPHSGSCEMSRHDALTVLSLEKHDRFLNASQFVVNEIRPLTLQKPRRHFAYLI